MFVGVDFTASNASQGRQSYYGKSLHDLDDTHINPYRQVGGIKDLISPILGGMWLQSCAPHHKATANNNLHQTAKP